jgi:hypothetical protein
MSLVIHAGSQFSLRACSQATLSIVSIAFELITFYDHLGLFQTSGFSCAKRIKFSHCGFVVVPWKILDLSANNEIITIMKIFALGFTTMRAVAPVRPNKKNRRAFFLFNFSHFNFFIVFFGGFVRAVFPPCQRYFLY